MEIINKNIDNGKSFDWGRASSDYAKYRDIYPEEFYNKLAGLSLGIKGQKVLDHYVSMEEYEANKEK